MIPHSQNKRFSCNSISNLIPVIIIFILGLIVYSKTFNVPFLFDDRFSITDNPGIRDIKNLKAIRDFDPTHFITYLSLALNFHFHRLNVFGYHLVNFVIHISTAILAWWLVRLIFLTPAMENKEIAKQSKLISLFSGLLFAVHPIQTEAVTYIIQRGTSLAALFYIASVALYLKARLLIITKCVSNHWKACYGLSLIAAISGMFTKQTVFTLPLMIITCEFFFLRSGKKFPASRVPFHGWKYLTPFLILLLIVPLNVAAGKTALFWHINELTKESDVIPRGHYLLTQFRVLVTYLRLLFMPLNQNLDYDYPVLQTLCNLPVLSSLFFLVFIIIAGILSFHKYRLVSFSILWFFLTLSVESSLIPIRDVIFEHRLYLPSISYCLFLPASLYYVFGGKRLKLWRTLLIILAGFYSTLAYSRNLTWSSELALWNDTVMKSPNKTRPYYNRGFAYQMKNVYDRAIADYNQALKIDPAFVRAYNNRGTIYYDKGSYDKALADYNQALNIDPTYVDAYNNRGLAYSSKGEYDKAIADYNQALKIDPDFAQAYYNRGIDYNNKGEYDKALADYNQALKIAPNLTRSYCARGLVYHDQGEYDKAISDYNQALNIDPNYTDAYNNRGLAYSSKGEYDKALADYNQALKINPTDTEVYNNRGIAYSNLAEYDKALADYNQVLKINPNYVDSYYNRGIVYSNLAEYDKALADYNQVLKINPNYTKAYHNRAVTYFMKKEYDKSWADVHKMQETGYPVNAEFLQKLREASQGEKE